MVTPMKAIPHSPQMLQVMRTPRPLTAENRARVLLLQMASEDRKALAPVVLAAREAFTRGEYQNPYVSETPEWAAWLLTMDKERYDERHGH